MNCSRVAHLTTVHHPLDPRIFWKECASLRRAGYEVFLVAQHDEAEVREGVQIVPLPRLSGRYSRVFLQRKAYRRARSLGASLYHVHDPELLPVAYLLKRNIGARIIYDVHENNFVQRSPERYLVSRLERWAFGWVDHVILAEDSYTSVLPTGTPHTVVLNYFQPFGQQRPCHRKREDESFQLLYTGVMGRRRGLDTMLDLATMVHDRALPWQMTLAGVCYVQRDRQWATQRIVQKGLQSRVTQRGWDAYIPWPDLEPYYKKAHVGLVLFDSDPNAVGSVPTKFYEYLFYGLPILCSDFPLWRRFIEEHRCGAVVPPGDAEQVFAVLRTWYDDPGRYAALSKAAAAAAPRYLWPTMARRLLGVYEDVLGDASTGDGYPSAMLL